MTEGRQASVPSIWARPQRRARGPVPEHSLLDIARVAIGLAQRQGLAAVSMRAVAAEVGTTASALYRYVASRDELLDLMVDTAMTEFAASPSTGDWLDDMAALAAQTLSFYLASPWLLGAMPAASTPGPNTLAWFEHCLRAMEPLDRSAMSKMETIGILNGVVMNFARSAVADASVDFSAIDPGRHPRLTAVLVGLASGGGTAGGVAAVKAGGDLFDRTVRALLAGLLGPLG